MTKQEAEEYLEKYYKDTGCKIRVTKIEDGKIEFEQVWTKKALAKPSCPFVVFDLKTDKDSL